MGRKKFKYDSIDIPVLPVSDVRKFLSVAKAGSLDKYLSGDVDRLELLLLNSYYSYRFIGEFPLSKGNFTYLCELIQREFVRGTSLQINYVPPALYIASMVFCARYTEEEARNFWTPYATLVWKTDPRMYFQNKCREHFVAARQFLSERYDLEFPVRSRGGVVRPVYYQAIIPSYLEPYFASWLVDQFEQILLYSVDELPEVLRSERSINYIPPHLRNFIQNPETADAAANLIQQMAKAVGLFQETEQLETVSSVMDSPIEKALWKEISGKLIKDEQRISQIRKYTPTLNWVYNQENKDFYLLLTNIKSDLAEKPDLIVWADSDSLELLDPRNVTLVLHPWIDSSGGWKLDPIALSQIGDLNGEIYVLSNEYDLEKNIAEQLDHIIFKSIVPDLNDEILYLFLSSRRNDARVKTSVQFEGEYLIFSKAEYEFVDMDGLNVEYQSEAIPELLLKKGYQFGRRYHLDLPINLEMEGTNKEYRLSEKANIIRANVVGEYQLVGLSESVQPVFFQPTITLILQAQIFKQYFNRIWISIHQGGKFLESVSLLELDELDFVAIDGNKLTIELEQYIKNNGSYSISILHNLESLLEVNLEFAYLPGLEVVGPDPDFCYSPAIPAQATLKGINIENVKVPDHSGVSVVANNDHYTIIWRRMKTDRCRFSLELDGNITHFEWPINRVTAWIEGNGNEKIVNSGQEGSVTLQVRGKPQEEFSWIEPESGNKVSESLNSKGIYSKQLKDSGALNLLKEDGDALSQITINIQDQTWQVFSYFRSPEIRIESFAYVGSTLTLILNRKEDMQGDYTVQVKDKFNPINIIILDQPCVLLRMRDYKVDLPPGTFFVEILLGGERVAFSSDFWVDAAEVQVAILPEEEHSIFSADALDEESLYQGLTATPQIINFQSVNRYLELLPVYKQIVRINLQRTWISTEPLDDGLVQMLPAWAVLEHPIIFHDKEHARRFTIYPQKCVFGGMAGKGYLPVKFDGDLINLYAAWNTDFGRSKTTLWLMVPVEDVEGVYCDLDEYDLWPAYQCLDCGRIVGSKEGTYLRLSPSTTVLHQHTQNRQLKEQFVDLVYGTQIDGSVSQNTSKYLDQCFAPEDMIDLSNYGGEDLIVESEGLSIPVSSSPGDFHKVLRELQANYKDPTKKIIIQQIISKRDSISNIENIILDIENDIPAFTAGLRLAAALNSNSGLLRLHYIGFLLALVTRLKPRDKKLYQEIIVKSRLSEDLLAEILFKVHQTCPKLIEWSVAWAEIFFVHSIP